MSMNIKITTTVSDIGDKTVVIPSSEQSINLTGLNRQVVSVPAQSSKEFFLSTGYHTDPLDPSTFVPYTFAEYKLLAIIIPAASKYSSNTAGASNIAKLNTVKVSSATADTGKVVLDSPFYIAEDANGFTFSDFFGTEVPYKVTLNNASKTASNFEILIGLSI